MNSFGKFFLLLAIVSSTLCCSFVSSTKISRDGRAIIIDGRRRVLFSGSIHYPRSTPEMWPDLIQKAKEGGLDAIETYVFWNAHEPRRRQYNFEGNLDLVRFIKEIKNGGLYVVLRIGPYVCAEWNYGGLPAWLRQFPGLQMRTNNQLFKDEMQNFTTLIINMLKQERLLAPQGGPIILTQIENEYGDIQGPYGEAGKQYIEWCAHLAESYHIGVPWIMCKQPDAPHPMINTCNGFYCDNFKPNKSNNPKMWTENWTGWFKAWDNSDPHRLVEDLAYSVARFFQSGGTFQNYYMYHGGTNFGRNAGGPYITTTYDYDAPLDEYGNIRQPKWGHLKELHFFIKNMENALLHGNSNTADIGNGLLVTNFSCHGVVPGCFIANTNETSDATLYIEGNRYFLPAWSVSILPDCKKEAYNTAKVNVQTSIMVKKPSLTKEEPAKLTWSWKSEILDEPLQGLGADFNANELYDQILASGDASDYLWYMTSVHIAQNQHMVLHVNTTGPILYVFVNGDLIGSKYSLNGDFSFVFEKNVVMKVGRNNITLLSVTVGLKNYGSYYELMPAGIVGGPVLLIGTNDNIIDLSTNMWFYKTGLHGEREQIYLDNSDSSWNIGGFLPTDRSFTWYKTSFQSPFGSEPVVVDLLGMGKGTAWINGQNIGRFWPNYIARLDGCRPCDYRGTFKFDKCQTGCGEPAQRWYHVPRSFLKDGEPNILIMFEEAGGDPSLVTIQTVTVGTICAKTKKGKTMILSCQWPHNITAIQFASFRDPLGACGSFHIESSDADGVLAVVEQACVGKPTCSIPVTEEIVGSRHCKNTSCNRLAVQATCS